MKDNSEIDGKLSPKEFAKLMVDFVLIDISRSSFVESFFNGKMPSEISEINRTKFNQELFLYDAVFVSVFLKRSAISLNKEELGEKIWAAYCSELMLIMGGEAAYKAYVADWEIRYKRYLKIFNEEGIELFMEKAAKILVEFVQGDPSGDYWDNASINIYLSHRLKEILQYCRTLLEEK